MSTKLTPEALAEIDWAHAGSDAMRCACNEYDCGCVTALRAHITALEEELKGMQERGSMLQQTLETRAERELEMIGIVERESVNNFRAGLVEAVRRHGDNWLLMPSQAEKVVQLITTF